MTIKNKNNGKYPLVAKTLFGLEDILAEELSALGAEDIVKRRRAVEFSGNKEILYKANLWCRTATRILKPIKTFQAASDEELYKRISGISWANYLDVDKSLAIDSVVSHSKLTNSQFVSQHAKDAIVDQFRAKTGKRPSVDREDPDLRINIHINKDIATLSLDSSGDTLGKRGYRTQSGEAPLSEVLAAGIILLTGWDMQTPFVDGMCGSGTFVIEAAMLARNIAPGLIRQKFAFQKWKDYAPAKFKNMIAEAEAAVKSELPFEIVGSDINVQQLKLASENAKRAGVLGDIKFEHKNLKDQKPPEGPGTLVINPPYGERMKPKDIEVLYTMIGDTFKQRFTGYDAWVLTSNTEAANAIGLRRSRRIRLYNGALDCRLIKFEMYKGSLKDRKSKS